ncbi:MAG: glycosyltransferase family 9 protein [Bacteroidia bacterium]|nr:glycosyltransferase family 9 protein [Bacteroidia bacterium]
MKILIIRFSSIGDIVLTTPVVRCVKNQIPDVEIHFLTKKNYENFLQTNPYITKIWTLDESLFKTINIIKSQKFELIIDLHNNLRTFAFKIFCNSKVVSFNKLNFRKFLLVKFKINILPEIHIVDRYLRTVKYLGVTNDGEGLDFFLPENTPEFKKIVLEKTANDFVCFAIGGQHYTKKLPLLKIIEIITKIDSKIVIIGGNEDIEIAEKLENEFTNKIINLAGKLSVSESAAVIDMAKVLITHDTGMMHIAAAFKKKIIAIWGNTVTAFGMYPYYGKYKVANKNFEVLNLNCRPCSKIGYNKCPQKHFNCMMLQDTNEIAKCAMSI